MLPQQQCTYQRPFQLASRSSSSKERGALGRKRTVLLVLLLLLLCRCTQQIDDSWCYVCSFLLVVLHKQSKQHYKRKTQINTCSNISSINTYLLSSPPRSYKNSPLRRSETATAAAAAAAAAALTGSCKCVRVHSLLKQQP